MIWTGLRVDLAGWKTQVGCIRLLAAYGAEELEGTSWEALRDLAAYEPAGSLLLHPLVTYLATRAHEPRSRQKNR